MISFSPIRPLEVNALIDPTFNPLDPLGSILDAFKTRIETVISEAINQAENAAIHIIVNAGKELLLAIDNAKIVYEKELKKTFQEIKDTTKLAINSLESLVQELEESVKSGTLTLNDEITNWIAGLPFASNQPQLIRVSPRYVVAADQVNQTAIIEFHGLFQMASIKGYTPTFTLDGHVLNPINITQNALHFQVPFTLTIQSICSYIHGDLTIPYYGSWLGPWYPKANYDVLFGILPEKVGTIEVFYTQHRVSVVKKHYSAPPIHASGDGHHGKGIVIQNITTAEPGWTIIPQTVTGPFIHDGAHGDHSNPVINSIDTHQVVTSVVVSAEDGKHMGIVDYHVEFDVTQEVPYEAQRQEIVDIAWGDSKVLDLQKNEELLNINFHSFDGRHYAYSGPDRSNPYLKIAYSNGQWTLKVERPSDIIV